MAAYQRWADASNISILHAFVSTSTGYSRVDDGPGLVFVTGLADLTSASLQRALLRMGAVSQKLIKPVTEKPATSRLFIVRNNPDSSEHYCLLTCHARLQADVDARKLACVRVAIPSSKGLLSDANPLTGSFCAVISTPPNNRQNPTTHI
ncbi:hypothetical protein [Pseudomonas sp. NFR16]|uniref:hypothetical protein n=1 Tax=Pseudomonas sp. NFR16 TaxID=1566248 RepID=UPI001160C0AC|nr:hypothetical protein [Pseudomonas sp. NFR16]